MIEPFKLEILAERKAWSKLAFLTFEQYGDCALVYYALFRHIELYPVELW